MFYPIGIANGASAILSLFIFPLWGILVDSLKRNKMIFVTVMILMTTSLDFARPWVVIFVSEYNTTTPANTTKSSGNFSFYSRLPILNAGGGGGCLKGKTLRSKLLIPLSSIWEK